MTLHLDSLIAIAFIAPVVFFVVLDVVMFRTRGHESAARIAVDVAPTVVTTRPIAAEAANDSTVREAA
jgi:hypothetical protein